MYFSTSLAFHCTTIDVIYDVMRVAAINIAAHWLGSPRDFFYGSRDFSNLDRCLICLARLTFSSKVVFPLCLMLFCFFLSHGSSLRTLMIRAEAKGTTSVSTSLLCMVSFTVILRPSQSLVALAISPMFFGDKSRGPRQTWHWLHHHWDLGIQLWSPWDWTSVAWWRRLVSDEPGFGKTEESHTYASSEPKAESVPHNFRN